MDDVIEQAWQGWIANTMPDLSDPELREKIRLIWFSSAYFLTRFLEEMRLDEREGEMLAALESISEELQAWRKTANVTDQTIMLRIIQGTKQ